MNPGAGLNSYDEQNRHDSHEMYSVRIQQLILVSKYTPVTMVGAVLAALGFALVQWRPENQGALLFWLVVLTAISLTRALNSLIFLRNLSPRVAFNRSEMLNFYGWLLTCISFGIGGLLFISPDDIRTSSLSIMILLGFSAAGAGAPLFIRKWGGLGVGLILIPSCFGTMISIGQIGFLGFALILIFVLLMTFASNRHIQMTRDAILFREISEKRAQSTEQALTAAEEASKAKSYFLSNMSHELRTPINAIGNYAMLIREHASDLGDETIVSDSQKIETVTEHLLLLVNDILDLSKIEAGYLNLLWEEIELGPFLEGLKTIARPIACRNENQFRFEAPKTTAVLEIDSTRLRQCLLNLISNAGKFTSRGVVSLSVRVDNSSVTFSVNDTGIGISPEKLSKLFQPFTQADLTTTKRYGGTGLGLYLTKQLTSGMGGRIESDSVEGVGTTFRLIFPQKRDRENS